MLPCSCVSVYVPATDQVAISGMFIKNNHMHCCRDCCVAHDVCAQEVKVHVLTAELAQHMIL